MHSVQSIVMNHTVQSYILREQYNFLHYLITVLFYKLHRLIKINKLVKNPNFYYSIN